LKELCNCHVGIIDSKELKWLKNYKGHTNTLYHKPIYFYGIMKVGLRSVSTRGVQKQMKIKGQKIMIIMRVFTG